MNLKVFTTDWEMVEPFITASEVTTAIKVVTVHLEREGLLGRAETLGVDYLGENAQTITADIDAVRRQVEAGASLVSPSLQVGAGLASVAIVIVGLWPAPILKLAQASVMALLGG